LVVVAVKSGAEISPERYTAAEPTTHVGRSGPVINEPYQIESRRLRCDADLRGPWLSGQHQEKMEEDLPVVD
jgi:hypothetical protein